MLLLKDISTSQEHRKNNNYKAPTRTTHVKGPHVNMERTDRWHLCECGVSGLLFPRGLPIVARLLVCPQNTNPPSGEWDVLKMAANVCLTATSTLFETHYSL